MKDVYELLRQKELERARLAAEVEALRTAAPLLSDDEAGDDNKPTSTRSIVPRQSGSLPLAVNDARQPADVTDWADKTQGWP